MEEWKAQNWVDSLASRLEQKMVDQMVVAKAYSKAVQLVDDWVVSKVVKLAVEMVVLKVVRMDENKVDDWVD